MATPTVATPIPPPIPRKKRAKRWPWVLLATLLLFAVPAVLLLMRDEVDRVAVWDVTSDRFVEAIALGAGMEHGGSRTGLAIAYDLLSEEKRNAVPFDIFFEEWTRLFDERGFIVEKHRSPQKDARGRARDPIEHLLFLGGEHDDHGRLTTMKLSLLMTRGGASVNDYTLVAVPNPRATR